MEKRLILKKFGRKQLSKLQIKMCKLSFYSIILNAIFLTDCLLSNFSFLSISGIHLKMQTVLRMLKTRFPEV